MFTNQDIVAVIFKLINFIALLGIAFFLFKKHLMPDLLNSIARKKGNQESLAAQQATLEKQQLNLDILLKEDSLMCENFRAKIDEWKKVVVLESGYRDKERSNTMIAYNKRFALIALDREHTRVQNTVIHSVVIDLEKSLSLHFNDSKQGSAYLNAIVQFMDERTL